VKIVHLTDIHVQEPPHLSDLRPKRLAGTLNLYVLGRRQKFSRAAQEAAVRATVDAKPDLVVFTGDLTAQALDAEFAAARVLLDPILSSFPAILIAGNHDTYVREPEVGAAMRRTFGPWMGPSIPWLHRHDGLAFLTIETCRPHPLSAGFAAPSQLARAAVLLEEMTDDPFVFLTIHYPLRDRRGDPYGPPSRALSNAEQIEALLNETTKVDAVLHGHEHHGYRTEIASGKGPIPILNPGATGYAYLPERDRTAHLCIYEADRDGIHDVQRLRFDGERFAPEPGGAFATGR
jgi:3',5'-cyclic AMP phosphodiesterase CpdA